MRSTLVDIEVIFVHATARAVLVRPEEGGEEVWLPLAACEIAALLEGALMRGSVAVLTAPQSLLEEKGLV